MNELSQRLSKAIEMANLSYRELSEITGIPKSAIQRYASGTTENFPIPRLEAIAAAIGVTAEYLLGWEKEEKPAEHLDELYDYAAELLTKLSPANQKIIMKLTPQNIDRLFGYAERLLEEQLSE